MASDLGNFLLEIRAPDYELVFIMAMPVTDTPEAVRSAHIDDPFLSSRNGSNYAAQGNGGSQFDFDLDRSEPDISSAQIRERLEIQLAETERRLQETSKLGTDLVGQQKKLSDELNNVEDSLEHPEELNRRLQELEKEFNEVGEDTARVFGSRLRPQDAEEVPNGAVGGDGRVSCIVRFEAFWALIRKSSGIQLRIS